MFIFLRYFVLFWGRKIQVFGFFCLLFLSLSCSPRSENSPLPPYQYPNDGLTRGWLLEENSPDKAYFARFPCYVDSLLSDAENINTFHYGYGVAQKEVPELLLHIAQNKKARLGFLKNLGISLSRADIEKTHYLNLSEKGLNNEPFWSVMHDYNLRELILAHNSIKQFGLALIACRNLKRLDLSSNPIGQIPVQISYLYNLEELNLRDTRLNSLPGNFSQLRKLRVLDLSNVHPRLAKGYNDFKYIPPVVCRLPNLEKLLLEKLPITHIPVSLHYLKNLKVLSLSGCRKLDLNNTFRILVQMPQIKVLDISFIGHRRLPNEIALLKNLKVLIWQEENNMNRDEIERLKNLLPDTEIYSASGNAIPFLRGNSVEMLIKSGNKKGNN